jgi:phosphoribosyl 1,2-cyclic phosphodiesterase
MSTTTNQQPFSIKFWGVRGSYPVPGAQTLHYGGNTACVEVCAGRHTIILDAGTGIIGLGRELVGRLRQSGRPIEATLLFSHLHHDHTQGFPFFSPAFIPSTRLNLFGTAILEHALEDVLGSTMSPPTFPITLREMGSVKAFYGLRDTDVVWLGESVGGVLVSGASGPGTPAGEGANVVRCAACAHTPTGRGDGVPDRVGRACAGLCH